MRKNKTEEKRIEIIKVQSTKGSHIKEVKESYPGGREEVKETITNQPVTRVLYTENGEPKVKEFNGSWTVEEMLKAFKLKGGKE